LVVDARVRCVAVVLRVVVAVVAESVVAVGSLVVESVVTGSVWGAGSVVVVVGAGLVGTGCASCASSGVEDSARAAAIAVVAPIAG
jgi:hypothetical protein